MTFLLLLNFLILARNVVKEEGADLLSGSEALGPTLGELDQTLEHVPSVAMVGLAVNFQASQKAFDYCADSVPGPFAVTRRARLPHYRSGLRLLDKLLQKLHRVTILEVRSRTVGVEVPVTKGVASGAKVSLKGFQKMLDEVSVVRPV